MVKNILLFLLNQLCHCEARSNLSGRSLRCMSVTYPWDCRAIARNDKVFILTFSPLVKQRQESRVRNQDIKGVYFLLLFPPYKSEIEHPKSKIKKY